MPRRRSLDRAQVVQAAIGCIEAEGADALGVNRVARALGIKPPSLYNHVRGGDDLARAVVIECSRRLLERFEQAVDGVKDPAERLRSLTDATRRWALDNEGLYTLMVRVPPDNDHPDFAPVMARILALFADAMADLGMPREDAVHLVRGLRAAVHGFVLLEISGQFALSHAVEESYSRLIDAILRGAVEGTALARV